MLEKLGGRWPFFGFIVLTTSLSLGVTRDVRFWNLNAARLQCSASADFATSQLKSSLGSAV